MHACLPETLPPIINSRAHAVLCFGETTLHKQPSNQTLSYCKHVRKRLTSIEQCARYKLCILNTSLRKSKETGMAHLALMLTFRHQNNHLAEPHTPRFPLEAKHRGEGALTTRLSWHSSHCDRSLSPYAVSATGCSMFPVAVVALFALQQHEAVMPSTKSKPIAFECIVQLTQCSPQRCQSISPSSPLIFPSLPRNTKIRRTRRAWHEERLIAAHAVCIIVTVDHISQRPQPMAYPILHGFIRQDLTRSLHRCFRHDRAAYNDNSKKLAPNLMMHEAHKLKNITPP